MYASSVCSCTHEVTLAEKGSGVDRTSQSHRTSQFSNGVRIYEQIQKEQPVFTIKLREEKYSHWIVHHPNYYHAIKEEEKLTFILSIEQLALLND